MRTKQWITVKAQFEANLKRITKDALIAKKITMDLCGQPHSKNIAITNGEAKLHLNFPIKSVGSTQVAFSVLLADNWHYVAYDNVHTFTLEQMETLVSEMSLVNIESLISAIDASL